MSDAPEHTGAGETTKRVQAVFDAADVEGYLHARDIDGDAEFTFRGDASVVLASVFKIPIALEYARQAAAGRCAKLRLHTGGVDQGAFFDRRFDDHSIDVGRPAAQPGDAGVLQ